MDRTETKSKSHNKMKPIEFNEQNVVFAGSQDEYGNLPAYKVDEPEGRVIFCQGLTFTERLRVLFTGKIWVALMTFNKPLTPSYLTTKKSDLFTE